MSTPSLVEHFFRREYASLVAVLSRRFGLQQFDAIEDAVQSALLTALDTWTLRGLPDNPSAWVFRVASNNLLATLRGESNRRRLLHEIPEQETEANLSDPSVYLPGEIEDELLRMLFLCCDDAIPQESQLVFALKTLCGFNIAEIALRLFTTEANVYKRFGRARDRLRKQSDWLKEGHSDQYTQRLLGVQKVIYVLFTEGYLSSHAVETIRRELCEEAIRLGELLANHSTCATPETFALLALMNLHLARMTARVDGSGGLLLLEEQDRSLWDQERIAMGLAWLAKSARGDQFTRFHAEAGIAAEHCLAPSYRETRWDRIVESYTVLEGLAPSPVHKLNRAIAVAEWRGPKAGLEILKDFDPPRWLEGTYLWSAVLADLYRRCGHIEKAKQYREAALNTAPTEALKKLLHRRLEIA